MSPGARRVAKTLELALGTQSGHVPVPGTGTGLAVTRLGARAAQLSGLDSMP